MDTQTIQRVRSHGAALNRYAYDFADQFLDAVFAACPSLRTGFRGDHQSQRRTVAQRWAWVVRHLGHLDQLTPEFEALGQFLGSRGMTAVDMASIRTAFLEAMQEVSGESWDEPTEAGWAETFDTCSLLMRMPAARIGPATSGESYAKAA